MTRQPKASRSSEKATSLSLIGAFGIVHALLTREPFQCHGLGFGSGLIPSTALGQSMKKCAILILYLQTHRSLRKLGSKFCDLSQRGDPYEIE